MKFDSLYVTGIISLKKLENRTLIQSHLNVSDSVIYGLRGWQQVLLLCQVRGFTLYLAKIVHDSTEIKLYSFALSWRLTFHKTTAFSSTLGLRTSLDRRAKGVLMDLILRF